MVFAVPATASAYNTYVGLKIESVNNPVAPSPTEWCLTWRNTSMTIKDGETTLDTANPVSDTCSGDTIWSGLVNLTASEAYTIDLATKTGDSAARQANGYIWWQASTNQSCDSICSTRNGCTMLETKASDVDCAVCAMFHPSYGVCYLGCHDWPHIAPYYQGNWQGGTCETGVDTTDPNCDSTGGPERNRFCTCGAFPLSYTFTFTAPAA